MEEFHSDVPVTEPLLTKHVVTEDVANKDSKEDNAGSNILEGTPADKPKKDTNPDQTENTEESTKVEPDEDSINNGPLDVHLSANIEDETNAASEAFDKATEVSAVDDSAVTQANNSDILSQELTGDDLNAALAYVTLLLNDCTVAKNLTNFRNEC